MLNQELSKSKSAVEIEEAPETQTEGSIFERMPCATRTMKWHMFAALTPHPRQRDTERHAEYALKRHLSQPAPAHCRTSAVRYGNDIYKVDGHTRAYLWTAGLLEAPENVHVDIYFASSWEDVLAIYSTFDNKNAVETTQDMLSGALREMDIVVQSPALKKYGFATALQIASRCFSEAECKDLYKNTREFRKEILMLDSINIHPAAFRVGVIAGAIICLRKHGDKALPFFKEVNENLGVKGAKECDPSFALRDVSTSKAGKSGFGRSLELAAKTISALERHLKNEKYSVSAKGVNVKSSKIAGYLAGLRAQTGNAEVE